MMSVPESIVLDRHSIPQDILECILDNLQDDKSILASCTLVCGSWSEPSRRRLFRTLRRRSKKEEDAGGSFLQFLRQHPYPHLIRVLELYAFGQYLCTRHILPVILSRLSNLAELRLWGLDTRCGCEATDEHKAASSLQLYRLERLEFNHLAHDTTMSFLQALGHFSEITTLVINCDAIIRPSPSGVTIVQRLAADVWPITSERLRVRSISMRGSIAATTSSLLYSVLAVTPSVRSLRTIRVTFDSARDLRVCASLLPLCANLREVHFGQWLTFDQKDYEAWDHIDLGSCDMLEECTIATTMIPFASEPGDSLDSRLQQNMSIINVLSRLPRSVHHVTIILYEADPDLGSLRDCYDWEQIQRILSTIAGQLRYITFKIVDNHDASNRYTQIRNLVAAQTAVLQKVLSIQIAELKDGW
ncbi:hypothetical protein BXZ70DRAFT_94852 [Cristinia sonorae]|uniref:F-box domain-containing protein n=1 Tax=Cristinia sonorae TaxID=1940300 RepID=A0A8K0US66_9AGAR|nr:hypothetical protein BXZ70DRAFT_94852 [Cristinia sonorae]